MQSSVYRNKREAEFLESGAKSYAELLRKINEEITSSDYIEESYEKELENEIKKTLERIELAKQKRLQCQLRRQQVAKKSYEVRLLRDALIEKGNYLQYEKTCLTEHFGSLSTETVRVATKLKKYMQINAVNDSFYIWYHGPFGTINGFRMGTLPITQVHWDEINAALGHAVLAVATVATRAGYEFKKYSLVPMGSFPKIIKLDERRAMPMQLYYVNATLNFLPKRNFNAALTGFLACIHELGEYTKSKDPTLALPYGIQAAEGIINDQLVFWGTDDDVWTRALKFLLTDIKWLIAWATKHCNSKNVLGLTEPSSGV